jgi:two-component system, OmpR family, phosphate regulon response regulator PhoB
MDGESRQIVLVADDDADVRDLVAFRLDRAGYEVMAAADGQDALELARSRSPDIAVLDVMMPRLDGLQVTRQMRAIDELARVPVLLLTASVHEAAVKQGFEAGADDYMKKPFSPADLVARVRALLGRT